METNFNRHQSIKKNQFNVNARAFFKAGAALQLSTEKQ